MIIVPVKEGENIDRALKKFKRKFEKTGAIRELRSRKFSTSVFRTSSNQSRYILVRILSSIRIFLYLCEKYVIYVPQVRNLSL